MITYIYVHRCGGCKFEGQQVEVRPEQRGTVFYLTPPRCIDSFSHNELMLQEVVLDGPTSE